MKIFGFLFQIILDFPLHCKDIIPSINFMEFCVAEKFPKITIAEEFEWKKSIEGSNAIVNLAGMPISTRWTSEVTILHELFLPSYIVQGNTIFFLCDQLNFVRACPNFGTRLLC